MNTHPPATRPRLWLADIRTSDSEKQLGVWVEQGLVTLGDVATAARYTHPQSRLQFLTGRALARHALALETGCAPHRITLHADTRGKPYAHLPGSTQTPHFNLSHSHGRVACALAQDAIGVDLEPVARPLDPCALAAAYFSAPEAAWINNAHADRSLARFTALWTLKEAFLKAKGIGLGIPLNTVQFKRFQPGRCEAQATAASPDEAPWFCRITRLPHDYWLALCAPQPFPKPRIEWFDRPAA